MLEKLWHAVFGEALELPPPAAYNLLRTPGTPLPLGSRIAALPKGAPESPGTTKLRWWEPTRCVNLPTPRVSAQPTSANPVKPVEV